jgi:hypothetical protein
VQGRLLVRILCLPKIRSSPRVEVKCFLPAGLASWVF